MILLLAAAFIGNQACQPCHSTIAAAYARTPMAQSSGRVESLAPVAFTAAGNSYKIADRRLIFNQGSVPFDFYIGSNAAGRSFLSSKEGYLYELPVTWYAQKQRWDASPGYEKDDGIRLNRAVEPTCLLCHTSRTRPVLGTQNRYGDPPFLDNGISCERCHGPASDHALNPTLARVVNPAKLEPVRRDSVCSQCHLTGEVRVDRPGRRFAEFRAGDRLADFATYFVKDGPGAGLKVTSHVEKLAASVCKQQSGDALWCGSCHDVHTNSNKTQAACQSCHPNTHHPKEQCAECHMPRAQTSDGGHGVMTDHSIPRKPRRPDQSATRTNIRAFLGDADDRALGLALAELALPRAKEHLLRAKPADAEVRLRLAPLETNPSRAAALYESVLELNPTQPVALVNLGTLYAQRGRTEEAAKLWKRALDSNPAIEEAVINLTRVLPKEEAKAILNRYRLFNPASVR